MNSETKREAKQWLATIQQVIRPTLEGKANFTPEEAIEHLDELENNIACYINEPSGPDIGRFIRRCCEENAKLVSENPEYFSDGFQYDMISAFQIMAIETFTDNKDRERESNKFIKMINDMEDRNR